VHPSFELDALNPGQARVLALEDQLLATSALAVSVQIAERRPQPS
jgi:hypothetical protein